MINLFVSFVKFRKARVGKKLKFSQDAQDTAMRFGNPEVEARIEKRKREGGGKEEGLTPAAASSSRVRLAVS